MHENPNQIYLPWERFFRAKIHSPFEAFLHAQMTSGAILMLMTVVALLWINSPLAEIYEHILHTHITLSIGSFTLDHDVHFWVNDGLMTLFFFLVGLEIKREILVGELSDIKVSILPILAAIGGMIIPAIIFQIITNGQEGSEGWGIPMATDIAFAVSVIVLLGNRVSKQLVTFLVALAIVDDLGAVSVIAIFYTAQINMMALMIAIGLFFVLIVFNRFGIRSALPYGIVGVFIWFFMLESGVHATIAGVLVAMTIPSLPKFNPKLFSQPMKKMLDDFCDYPIGDDFVLKDEQKIIVKKMKQKIIGVEAPLNRYENALHLPIGLMIIPLFALINAGIPIDFSSLGMLLGQPVSLGIIFGLVVGKVIGIFGVSWLAIKLGIAKLPENATISQLFGVSFLGGIGFTMSIFVADLAYSTNPALLVQSKTAILSASVLAGLIGYFWLRFVAHKKQKD
ncbi:Na+/H+ antiporter NhaA [Sulfurospirillum sp. 1612]|uniref:Na+/H+ antiporter NhaA n=1 Tax=Sulfurospirillum sp. 1612 TaxID=3094835 RepID=UPI002F94BA5A